MMLIEINYEELMLTPQLRWADRQGKKVLEQKLLRGAMSSDGVVTYSDPVWLPIEEIPHD